MSLVRPPTDGSLLLSEALHFNTNHNADRPFYVYAGDDSHSQVTSITHLEFGRACHRVAHAVRPNRSGPDVQVVAIIALADSILYQAITVGLIVSGLIPLLISPRNSAAAIVNILQKTSCRRVIVTKTTLQPLMLNISSLLKTIDKNSCVSMEEMPSLAQIFPHLGCEAIADPFSRFPSALRRPEAHDICLYFHSSGSTGFPKPIPFTHSSLLLWASYPILTDFRDAIPPHVVGCMTLPPFHQVGFCMQVLYPVYGVFPVSVYPPVVTSTNSLPLAPSPDVILDYVVRTCCTSIYIMPTYLQLWCHSKKAVEILKSLRLVAYSGGALSSKSGNFLFSSGVKIRCVYGGTEFSAPTYILPLPGDEADWEWMRFHDKVHVRWISQGDQTYECQFLAVDTHVLEVENLEDARGYATSDIFSRHPTKPYLWKIVGRIDDVIIHSSGEKTVPAPMETVLMGSAIVRGAVMFGSGHESAGVLIEPAPEYAIDVQNVKEVAKFRNDLWPTIEEANKDSPTFSRIFKEMILITSRAKPLPRAGKGTVLRKAALQMYDIEITLLYNAVDSGTKGVLPPDKWSSDVVQTWLLDQIADIQPRRVFDPSVDLFAQGFDSLSVTFLRLRIVSAIISSGYKSGTCISQNTIYSYPTVSLLSAFIAEFMEQPTISKVSVNMKKAEMEDMIKKYSIGSEAANISSRERRSGLSAPEVVLITGSAGNLGSHILAFLLEAENIGKIYALSRPSVTISLLQRHRQKFIDKAVNTDLLESNKLTLMEGDVSHENLGLAESQYAELLSSVTTVIHTAWKLDFNMSLVSFEPHIRGTRNLIDFARSCSSVSTLRFLFTSSVASAQGWDPKSGPFREEVEEDSATAIGNGYGESKYIAERILAKSGLQVTSLRIGQISGGNNGAWSITEWFPILVKSSLELGCFPDAKGVVSWTKIDDVARTILDIASAVGHLPVVLNMTHPRPMGWTHVISAVKDAVVQERHLASSFHLVPFRNWFTVLEERATSANKRDLQNVPAIKLLEFFRVQAFADDNSDSEVGGVTKFSTVKARHISNSFKNSEPIEISDIHRWVRYWNNVGLFD